MRCKQAGWALKGWRAAAAALALVAAGPSALAVDAGVTDTTIRLGASVVLSGPLGPQTLEYGAGARLWFEAINAQGGIHGRKISYTTLDDGFDVKRAVENTRKLIDEQQVFLLFNNTGTAQTAAILPLAVESRTVVFSPLTGATPLRAPNRYLFHVRASYADEARAMALQLQQMGVKRVALFYQDDGLGKALQAEVDKAAQAAKVELVAQVALNPKTPDFKQAAEALAQAQPQVVIMGTAGTTFTDLIKAVRAQTPLRPSFYGFSVASLDVIRQELGESARGIVLAQVWPSMNQPSVVAVADYMRLLKQKDPNAQPSVPQFEGFVQARLLTEGLQRAGRKLTTDSFIAAMEGLGEVPLGRFVAKYGPGQHNGSTYVELAILDNRGQLRY
jgi:ABC-type branched-subunit amino acid transport system substrate-binding protein